jgi:hypothetical protein
MPTLTIYAVVYRIFKSSTYRLPILDVFLPIKKKKKKCKNIYRELFICWFNILVDFYDV